MRAQRRRSTSDRSTSGDDQARKKRRPANNLQLYLASVLTAGDDGVAASLIGDRLESLLKEAGQQGVPPHDVIKAIMAWAAQQSYAEGGYPHAKSLMLDTLEAVLILEAAAMKKTAA